MLTEVKYLKLLKLIEAGIVKKLMPAKLDDLRGEPNLLRIK